MGQPTALESGAYMGRCLTLRIELQEEMSQEDTPRKDTPQTAFTLCLVGKQE